MSPGAAVVWSGVYVWLAVGARLFESRYKVVRSTWRHSTTGQTNSARLSQQKYSTFYKEGRCERLRSLKSHQH